MILAYVAWFANAKTKFTGILSIPIPRSAQTVGIGFCNGDG